MIRDSRSIAPLDAPLQRSLDAARNAFGLRWVGIADFAAPEGVLTRRWLAQSPVGAMSEPIGDSFPGPSGPVQHHITLDLSSGVPGPPVALYLAADQPVAEAQLRQLSHRLRGAVERVRHATMAECVLRAVEQAPDPIEVTDREGALVYANQAWTSLFGYDPQQAFGRTVASLFRDPVAPLHDAAFYQFTMARIQGGNSWLGALANRCSDGSRVFCEAHVTPFESAVFHGNVAIRRGLAHRQERDEALAKAHREFRAVLSSLPDGAVVLRDAYIYFANEAFCTMVGRSLREVIGAVYNGYLHPDDQALLDIGNVQGTVQVRIMRPDGRPRISEISVAGVLSFEGRPATILMSRDVTERQISREMLARAERLSALGSLAAGLAHEINNPLAYLMLNLQTLHQHIADKLPGDTLDLLVESIDGASRIHRIVTELRAFSGSDHNEQVEHVDVANAVHSALNIAHNEIRHRAQLKRNLEPGAAALCREGPLVQVLVSLLVNAAQAIPEDEGDHCIEVGSSTDAQWVKLTVRDTGVGIHESELPLVFDPFYTTKPRKDGSGLGLSIARRIIEDFGGTIALESELGKGTNATVTLPLAHRAPGPARATHALTAPPENTLRVLIVDDEPSIVRALARVLPHHSLVLTHGTMEALATLEEHADFDVVLCDLMMPGVSGPEFYRRAIRMQPRLEERFLFMTGGAFTKGALDFLSDWPLPVLEKPFDPDVLIAQIHKVSRGDFKEHSSTSEIRE